MDQQRACECFVGFVDLAETAIRETEIVQNAFVVRREFRSTLQTIDRRAIVTVLIQRETEVVQRVGVFFELHGAFKRFLGAIAEAFFVVGDSQKVVRFGQLRIERHGRSTVRRWLRYTTFEQVLPPSFQMFTR